MSLFLFMWLTKRGTKLHRVWILIYCLHRKNWGVPAEVTVVIPQCSLGCLWPGPGILFLFFQKQIMHPWKQYEPQILLLVQSHKIHPYLNTLIYFYTLNFILYVFWVSLVRWFWSSWVSQEEACRFLIIFGPQVWRLLCTDLQCLSQERNTSDSCQNDMYCISTIFNCMFT